MWLIFPIPSDFVQRCGGVIWRAAGSAFARLAWLLTELGRWSGGRPSDLQKGDRPPGWLLRPKEVLTGRHAALDVLIHATTL